MKKLNAPFLLKYRCPLFGFFDNDSTLEFKKKKKKIKNLLRQIKKNKSDKVSFSKILVELSSSVRPLRVLKVKSTFPVKHQSDPATIEQEVVFQEYI